MPFLTRLLRLAFCFCAFSGTVAHGQSALVDSLRAQAARAGDPEAFLIGLRRKVNAPSATEEAFEEALRAFAKEADRSGKTSWAVGARVALGTHYRLSAQQNGEEKELFESLRVLRAAAEAAQRLPADTLSAYLLASAYKESGLTLREGYWYEAALQMFLKAKTSALEAGNKAIAGAVCSSIATIYYADRNYRAAKEYAFLSYSYNSKTVGGFNLGTSYKYYNNIGLCCDRLADYDSALHYYQKALGLAQEAQDTAWVGLVSGNMGSMYGKLGDYEKAVPLLEVDIEYSLETELYASAANAKVGLAEILLKTGEYGRAERMFLEAKGLIDSLDILETPSVGIYKGLAQIAEQKGEYRQALEYNKRYMALHDSIDEAVESADLMRIEQANELELRQAEIRKLELQNEAQRTAIRRSRLLQFTGGATILMLFLSAFFAARAYLLKSKANELLVEKQTAVETQHKELRAVHEELAEQSGELVKAHEKIRNMNKRLEAKVSARTVELERANAQLSQVNSELDTFLYRSSHDLRRPISTLLGLASVARLTVKDPEAAQLLESVETTALGMDRMLEKLIIVSNVQYDADFGAFDLRELVESRIVNLFAQRPEANGAIEFEVGVAEGERLYSQPGLIGIVLDRLLENAVIFRKTSPDVQSAACLSFRKRLGYGILTVRDNGNGIGEEHLGKVFEMYTKGSEASQGNGLGLYVARKAAERMGGRVLARSQERKFAEFSLAFPLLSMPDEAAAPLQDEATAFSPA